MAEAVARREASDVIEPSSAGLYPLGHISSPTAQALLSNGYSIEHLSSKPLRHEAVRSADLIINLSGESLADLTGLPPIEDWLVADPYGQDPATYQRILEEIESRVRQLAERLRADRRSSKS